MGTTDPHPSWIPYIENSTENLNINIKEHGKDNLDTKIEKLRDVYLLFETMKVVMVY